MPTSYVIRDKTGRQLDRISAGSREEATKLFKAKRSNVPAKTVTDEPSFLNKAWEAATHEYLPEHKFQTGFGGVVDKPLDFAYEYGLRPMSSPLGLATTAVSPLKAASVGGAVMRGLRTPVNAIARSGTKTNVLSRMIAEGKQMALTTGLPGTNISFHGISEAASNAMATPLREGGIIGGGIKSARMLLSPKYAASENARLAARPVVFAGKTLTKPGGRAANGRILPRVTLTYHDLAKASGLTLEGAQQAVAPLEKPLITAGKYNPLRFVRNVQEELFDKPLFEQMVPAMKQGQFQSIFDELAKKVKPKTEAEYKALAKTAAETGNNIFGGLGKGAKWNKGGMKYILLAPDWYERHVHMGKGIAKALWNFKDPRGAAYRTFASNMVQTMGLMDVANKTISGHHLWENQPGKFFQIDTGNLNEHGQRIYIDPTAGALDFARLPIEAIHGIVSGKSLQNVFQPIQNRLNVVNRFALDAVGANYKPAVWRDPFPKRERLKTGEIRTRTGPPLSEQFGRVAEDVFDSFSPGWAQGAEDIIHQGERDPKVSKMQFITKSFEIPVKYAKDKAPEIMTRAEAAEKTRDAAKRRREKQRLERQKKREGGR